MNQILVNTAASLTFTWYQDGTATDVGDVTIGIVNDDGDTIVASGTATTNNGDGTYTYAVANSLTGTVDLWTATWTDTSSGDDQTTRIEIVGGYLFTEAEARAFDGDAMSNATNYPDADIAATRVRITDLFEEICGVSFVPRYRRQTIPGTGDNVLVVDRPRVRSVISASIDGTAQTVADIDISQTPSDELHHTTATWTSPTTSDPFNVTVEYEHGHREVPAAIKRAALMLARYELVDSNVSDRALSLTNEFGNVRLSVAGMGSAWVGLPYVDATLNRYMARSFV